MEKRNQQSGNMRAIDIGIGHDDDLFIAQARIVIRRAHAAAECQNQIADLLALLHFGVGGIGNVENFSAQRQHRLVAPIAPLFGTAARAIALDDENLGALG